MLGNAREARADTAGGRSGDRKACDGHLVSHRGDVAAMIDSKLLPPGAVQLICGSAGDLLAISVFRTRSRLPDRRDRPHAEERRAVAENNVRFNLEADSLNYSILGPDAVPGTEEFDLFIKEVVREMTVKAGQKCTAIRRTLVPEGTTEDVIACPVEATRVRAIGDPAVEGVRMGPLAGQPPGRRSAEERGRNCQVSERVYGSDDSTSSARTAIGSVFPAAALLFEGSVRTSAPHDVEAFGPVNTVMPYKASTTRSSWRSAEGESGRFAVHRRSGRPLVVLGRRRTTAGSC